MNIKIGSLFSSRWEVFWATTYNFELELFDEYLFRRLGDPPLNATVLADFVNLSATWGGISTSESWRTARVNRDYLIRGLRSRTGRFHPKTYFLANENEGILLIGSGNLSLDGLERGLETFCRFDSKNGNDLSAMRAWRDWVQRLLDDREDEELLRRWFRLRQTAKWLSGPSSNSPFVSNLDRSLLELFCEGLPRKVDELHVMAPFFDEDAGALANLIQRTSPKVVVLYLSQRTSVSGTSLQSVLDNSSSRTQIFGFKTNPFVHAKLVGVTFGSKGRVLSGSANLSHAALDSVLSRDSWANVEAGVLFDSNSDHVRSLFQSSREEMQERDLESLAELKYEAPSQELGVQFRLEWARAVEGGFVEVFVDGVDDLSGYVLTNGGQVQPLEGRRTNDQMSLEGGTLVWINDDQGIAVSNRVPVDDPIALTRVLEKTESTSTDRPRELDTADLQTPVGQVLLRLHIRYIFDPDDTEAFHHAERENELEEGGPEGNFWEKLARDELELDRRATGYRFSTDSGFDDNELFFLLRLMLDRTPEAVVMQAGTDIQSTVEAPSSGKGKPWTPTQRLEVRLVNVLSRWSGALTDGRMNWIHPFASVRNYMALLAAIGEIWELQALPDRKLTQLLGNLMGNFVRSDRSSGYIFGLGDEERERAVELLKDEARNVAAALVYLGVRHGAKWDEYLFEWQAWLAPAMELQILEASEASARLAGRLIGAKVSALDVAERLQWAAQYIDDPHWCKKMETLCGLERVTFSSANFIAPFRGLVLDVSCPRPLVDEPGVVRLVRNALDYRKADGIIVMSGDERISVRLGEQAYARLTTREELETFFPVDERLLAKLDENGIAWMDAFRSDATQAS